MRNIIIALVLFVLAFNTRAASSTYIKGPQLVESNQSIISSGVAIALTATSPMNLYITGTAAQTVNLPSVSTIAEGSSYKVYNKSTQAVAVKDFLGGDVGSVFPNTDKGFTLFAGGLWVESVGGSLGKTLVGSAPIVITQDASTATISFDNTKAKQFGGAIEVPTFVNNGGGNVTVNSLMVNLWENANFAGDAQRYTVGSLTATITDLVTSYIVADYNAGSPILRVTTDVNEITESNIVPIFTMFRSGSVLHALDWDTLGRGLANKVHQSIVKTDRYRRESGLSLSESGTRNVDLTSGIIWVGANKASLTSIASATDNMYYFLRTAPSAWTTTSVTQYNNNDYFNGTTTVALGGGRYAVNWLFRGVESQKHLYMVIGEGNYSLAQAQASQPPASLPPNITSHAVLVGRIIVLKGASVATQIDSAFNVVFTQSAASNHNDLSGLNGDPDYYHLSQTKYNAVQNLTASGTQTNFTGDVQSASCVYYGDSVTNGSYRDCVTGGVFKKEKRVFGSWSEIFRVE